MKDRTLLLFALLHLVMFAVFAVMAQAWYPSPGELERYMATRILDGAVPYRDLASEYPPLALLSFLLPALLFKTSPAYAFAFAGEMLLFDLALLATLAALARRLGTPVRATLTAYSVMVLVVGPIAVVRYDFLPAMFTILAVWALLKDRNKTAWAMLALGVAAKLYPLVLAPLFVIWQIRDRRYGQLAAGAGVFVAVLAATSVPWLIVDAPGYAYSMGYHLERGLHSESTYGTTLLLGQALGWTSVQGALTYGSWNLSSPLADGLAKGSFYISAVLLLAAYSGFGWLLWRENTRGRRRQLLQFTLLAILIFMLTNKVFSAQYLIWALPFLPLLSGDWRVPVWSLFVLAAALTMYIYPYRYIEFASFHTVEVLVMAFRNGLLVVIGARLGWKAGQEVRFHSLKKPANGHS